jgi:hypothetical protein
MLDWIFFYIPLPQSKPFRLRQQRLYGPDCFCQLNSSAWLHCDSLTLDTGGVGGVAAGVVAVAVAMLTAGEVMVLMMNK